MAGFQQVRTQGASGYTGKVQTFSFLAADANQMAIGDAVIVSGTGNADGIAAITRASGATATEVTGIITGFAPDLSNLELKGRDASTDRLATVQVDPDALYEIEIGTALDVTDIGSNLLFNASAPSTTGNLVRSEMTTAAVDAAGPLRLVGLLKPSDGSAIGSVGSIAVVAVIRSQQTNLTGV